MQTFAVRGSDCRHFLFTAPAGCLLGKLIPFPLYNWSVLCVECSFSAEAASHNKTAAREATCNVTFRVLGIKVVVSCTTSLTSKVHGEGNLKHLQQ